MLCMQSSCLKLQGPAAAAAAAVAAACCWPLSGEQKATVSCAAPKVCRILVMRAKGQPARRSEGAQDSTSAVQCYCRSVVASNALYAVQLSKFARSSSSSSMLLALIRGAAGNNRVCSTKGLQDARQQCRQDASTFLQDMHIAHLCPLPSRNGVNRTMRSLFSTMTRCNTAACATAWYGSSSLAARKVRTASLVAQSFNHNRCTR
jgi:hypothetical protein